MTNIKEMLPDIRVNYTGDVFDPRAMNSFVKGRLGNMCYISRMPQKLDDPFGVGIMVDELIIDSIQNKPRIHFQRYDNVFRGYCEDGDLGRVAVFPNRNEIHDKFRKAVNKVNQISEGCALDTFGSKILEVHTVKTQLNPLFQVIDTLIYDSELTMEDLKRDGWNNEKKRERYLTFLQDLNIISISKDRVYAGPIIDKCMDEHMSPDDKYKVLAKTISDKGFTYLQNSLGSTNIRPFIRMSNANYMTSLIDDKPLKWDWVKYGYYLNHIYRENKNIGKMKIISNAVELRNVGIFTSQKMDSGDSAFCCEDDLFDDYRKIYKRRVGIV